MDVWEDDDVVDNGFELDDAGVTQELAQLAKDLSHGAPDVRASELFQGCAEAECDFEQGATEVGLFPSRAFGADDFQLVGQLVEEQTVVLQGLFFAKAGDDGAWNFRFLSGFQQLFLFEIVNLPT